MLTDNEVHEANCWSDKGWVRCDFGLLIQTYLSKSWFTSSI